MIKSAVRGFAVTALTTTLALLPTAAQAEQRDKGNDIERVELTGVNTLDTSPPYIWVGSKWVTRTMLYTEERTQQSGKRLLYAGDSESDCSAVQAFGTRVTAQCTRVLRLPKGTLTLSDMITYSSHEPVTARTAIIGGTGHYRSAYGDGYITLNGRNVRLQLNVDE